MQQLRCLGPDLERLQVNMAPVRRRKSNYAGCRKSSVPCLLYTSEWFMQTYGDWNYQTVPFVMPTDSQKQDIADTDDAPEESLVKEAEEKAAA